MASRLVARADVPRGPERLADWNEHPLPMPAPPQEKEELAYRLLAATAWVLGSAVLLPKILTSASSSALLGMAKLKRLGIGTLSAAKQLEGLRLESFTCHFTQDLEVLDCKNGVGSQLPFTRHGRLASGLRQIRSEGNLRRGATSWLPLKASCWLTGKRPKTGRASARAPSSLIFRVRFRMSA